MKRNATSVRSGSTNVSSRSSIGRVAQLKARAAAAKYRAEADKEKAECEKDALEAQLRVRTKELSIAAKEAEIEAEEYENVLQESGDWNSDRESSLSWDDDVGRRRSHSWNNQRQSWTSSDRVQKFLNADQEYVPSNAPAMISTAVPTAVTTSNPIMSQSTFNPAGLVNAQAAFIPPVTTSKPITRSSILDDFGFDHLVTSMTQVTPSVTRHNANIQQPQFDTIDEFAFLNQYDTPSSVETHPRTQTLNTPRHSQPAEDYPRSYVHTRGGTTVTPPPHPEHSSILTPGNRAPRLEQESVHGNSFPVRTCKTRSPQHGRTRDEHEPLSELSTTAALLEEMVQGCARTNIQVAQTLALTQLPRIECEKFSGDACSYTHWKRTVLAQLSMAMTFSERLLRLSRLVEKEPAEIVRQYSDRFPNQPQLAYQKAWEILDYRFGRACVIADALLSKLNGQKKIAESDYSSLRKFADLCTSVSLQIQSLPGLKVLDYPLYLRPITGKLPTSFQRKWTDHAYRLICQARREKLPDKEYPTFQEFAMFLETLADKLCDPNLRPIIEEVNKNSKFGQNPGLKDLKQDKVTGVGGKVAGFGNPDKKPPSEEDRKAEDKDANNAKKRFKFCPAHPGLPKDHTHGLGNCRKFQRMSVAEQVELLKAYPENCRSCLETGHKTCQAEIKCSKCQKRHHTFLHDACDKLRSADRNPNHSYAGARSETPRNYAICPAQRTYGKQPESKELVQLNVLHDSGSNVSLVLKGLCEKLNAQKASEETITLNVEVLGGDKITTEAHCYRIPLYDSNGNLTTSISAYGIERIGSDLPGIDVSEALRIFGLEPESEQDIRYPSGPVHVLIGTDNAHVTPSIISRVDGMVLAESTMGILVYGSHPSFGNVNGTASYKVTIKPSDLRMDLVPSLFATDVIGISCTPKCGGCACKQCPADGAPHTLQERYEYEQIKNSMTLESGVITASYPYVRDPTELPNNYELALRRLCQTERSLAKDPVRARKYQEQIDDMIARGVLRKLTVAEENAWTGAVQYLPHNDVNKPGSESTPIRLVLDPSSPYKGKAVNQFWGRGPCLMNDPIGILLRFREHPTAFAGDISKMYWCVHTRPKEWHLHRILWRNMDVNRQPDKYLIVRNSFGSGPAGTVAIAALNFLADRKADELPDAARVIQRQAFVDDIIDSTPTIAEAEKLTSEVDQILSEGSFKIKKWTITSTSAEHSPPRGSALTQNDSVLGISWDTTADEFFFEPHLNFSKKRKKVRQGPDLKPGQILDPDIVPALTKRAIISQVNSLYDPLGLLSPFLVELKFGIAKLWRHKEPLNWDDPIPQEIDHHWRKLFELFFGVSKLRFPRLLRPSNAIDSATLLAFSDSSMISYCAAVYIRWRLEDGLVFARLVMSKSRMWPIEPDDYLSVARGELMGILLAKRLVATVIKESRFQLGEIAYVSDSEIALAQVNMNSHEFGVWTGTRVAEIRTNTNLSQFWFARSGDNQSADLCSRGTTDLSLLDRESTWQRGPPWIYRPREEWPLAQNVKGSQPIPDLRAESLARRTLMVTQPPPDLKASDNALMPVTCPFVTTIPCAVYKVIQTLGESASSNDEDFAPLLEIAKFSRAHEDYLASLFDLRRHDDLNLWLAVTARILYAVSWKSGTPSIIRRLTEPLVPAREREIARQFWLRQAQRSLVPAIKSGKYASLTPFLDESGVWRINGRSRSTSDYLPVLLPHDHPVSRLIVIAVHRRCHDGRGSTASRTRADYHILKIRRLASQVRKECQLCTLKERRLLKIPMAPLPIARLEPTYAFEHTSCDLFGPIAIKLEGRVTRSRTFDPEKLKAYGAVFSCLSTRAVHLEVMQGQDTDAFLLALRRFVATRGQPRSMYSDNGGQLVAADQELRNLVAEWDTDRLRIYGAENGMTWSWTSPGSPWANGITEGLVKSVKRSLKYALPSNALTILELQTVLTEVAELLNERPIGIGSKHFSGDDFDGETNSYICPNQLLLGRSTTRVPAGPFETVSVSHANRFLANQSIVTKWWKHWTSDYLPSLVPQSKWFRADRLSKVGDIVQVKDLNPVRGNWNIAEVIGTKPADDNLPRSVLLRYKTAHPGREYKSAPYRTQWRDVKNLSLLIAVEDRSEMNPLASPFVPENVTRS